MEIIKKIGNGTFGAVYEVVVDGERRAAKTSVLDDDKYSIDKESAQLKRVNHISIVTVFGILLRENVPYLIMEYMEGGSMRDLLGSKDFKFTDVINWFYQVAAGLAYLHAMTPQPMLHRDIKPHNILLSKDLKLAKIGDFGTSRDLASTMTNNAGTALYMAPEVFEAGKYTEKCDVYSFGMSLWEMLARKRPFAEYDNAWQIQWAAHMGKRPSLEGLRCHIILNNLLSFCWHEDPTERPPMDMVFKVLRKVLKLYKLFEMGTGFLVDNMVGPCVVQKISSAELKVRHFLVYMEIDTDSSKVLETSPSQWAGNRVLIESPNFMKTLEIPLLQWVRNRKYLLIGIADDSKVFSQISKDQRTSKEVKETVYKMVMLFEHPFTSNSEKKTL